MSAELAERVVKVKACFNFSSYIQSKQTEETEDFNIKHKTVHIYWTNKDTIKCFIIPLCLQHDKISEKIFLFYSLFIRSVSMSDRDFDPSLK